MANLEIRPPEWNDNAPVRIEADRHISASADAVFGELADHGSWPEWFPQVTKVEVTGAGSGVGATRRVHLRGVGRFDEVFHVWEPGKAYGFSVVKAPVPIFRAINEMVTISDEDASGVTVHYLQAMELARWSGPASGLMRRQLQGSLKRALRELAARVEI